MLTATVSASGHHAHNGSCAETVPADRRRKPRDVRSRSMTFLRLLRAWLIIVPLMIANGVLRELVLERWTVAIVAEVLSVCLGMAIIVVMTRYLLRPLAGQSATALVRASVTLVLLTVA